MEHEARRFPLSWPTGWKRTTSRKEARFFSTSSSIDGLRRYKGGKVTIAQAIDRLDKQLELLGAREPLLSTNMTIGLRGDPLSSRGEPQDPGAACYFKLKDKPRVLACDTWNRCADNIAAIASHIDAMRRIERYGVGNLEQAFAGYDALPAPSADNRAPWRGILGFKPQTPAHAITAADVNINYRSLAKLAGNDEGRLLELNLARDEALRELGG